MEELPNSPFRQLTRGVKIIKAAEGDADIIFRHTSKVCLFSALRSKPSLAGRVLNVNPSCCFCLQHLTYNSEDSEIRCCKRRGTDVCWWGLTAGLEGCSALTFPDM